MNYKYYIKSALILCSFPLIFTGCELFGLNYQDSYEYDYKAGIPENNVKMSTFDFIKSRPDLFSILDEAIVFSGLENEFKKSEATYLLPTNTAFNSEDASAKSYFQLHQITGVDEITGLPITYAPTSMIVYGELNVKEFLLYHIVKGRHTWNTLPAEPTWFPSFATADTAVVNMYILKDRNPNLVFNNFDGHYKSTIKPRTANLMSSDGSYIHVLDSWIDRPTKKQLNMK